MNEVDWDVYDRTEVAAFSTETPSESWFLDLGFVRLKVPPVLSPD